LAQAAVYARMKIFINFAAKLARPIVSEPPPAAKPPPR